MPYICVPGDYYIIIIIMILTNATVSAEASFNVILLSFAFIFCMSICQQMPKDIPKPGAVAITAITFWYSVVPEIASIFTMSNLMLQIGNKEEEIK